MDQSNCYRNSPLLIGPTANAIIPSSSFSVHKWPTINSNHIKCLQYERDSSFASFFFYFLFYCSLWDFISVLKAILRLLFNVVCYSDRNNTLATWHYRPLCRLQWWRVEILIVQWWQCLYKFSRELFVDDIIFGEAVSCSLVSEINLPL